MRRRAPLARSPSLSKISAIDALVSCSIRLSCRRASTARRCASTSPTDDLPAPIMPTQVARHAAEPPYGARAADVGVERRAEVGHLRVDDAVGHRGPGRASSPSAAAQAVAATAPARLRRPRAAHESRRAARRAARNAPAGPWPEFPPAALLPRHRLPRAVVSPARVGHDKLTLLRVGPRACCAVCRTGMGLMRT